MLNKKIKNKKQEGEPGGTYKDRPSPSWVLDGSFKFR